MPRCNQQMKPKQTKSRCRNYTTAHKEIRINLLQKFNEMDEMYEKVKQNKTKEHQTPHSCLQTDSAADAEDEESTVMARITDLETDSEVDAEDEVNYHKKKHQYGGRYKYSKKAKKKKFRPRISRLRNPSQAIRPLKLTQSKILKIKTTKIKGKMHSTMKLMASNKKPSLTIGDEAKWAINNYLKKKAWEKLLKRRADKQLLQKKTK